MDKPWDWSWGLSQNKNITMEFIEKHSDKPWSWFGISFNPNLTMEFIEKYPDKEWSWAAISSNENITIEIIENNPDIDLSKINQLNTKDSIPWDWENISSNKNITLDVLKKYPDKPWNLYWLNDLQLKKEKEKFLLNRHRQFIKENLKEELAMIALHPLKIKKYLSMGYDIEKLDEIM